MGFWLVHRAQHSVRKSRTEEADGVLDGAKILCLRLYLHFFLHVKYLKVYSMGGDEGLMEGGVVDCHAGCSFQHAVEYQFLAF